MLAAFGYGVTNEPGEADLWVLNSCAVKAPSEHAFNNMIEKGQIAGKKLVLAGCVRNSNDLRKWVWTVLPRSCIAPPQAEYRFLSRIDALHAVRAC